MLKKENAICVGEGVDVRISGLLVRIHANYVLKYKYKNSYIIIINNVTSCVFISFAAHNRQHIVTPYYRPHRQVDIMCSKMNKNEGGWVIILIITMQLFFIYLNFST